MKKLQFPIFNALVCALFGALLEYFESCVNNKYEAHIGPNAHVWLLENGGHIGSPVVVPDEYSQRRLPFFEMAFKE